MSHQATEAGGGTGQDHLRERIKGALFRSREQAPAPAAPPEVVRPERRGRGQPFDVMCRTLKKAASALNRAEIPFLLGWSFACWARGGRQPRHDVDLLIAPEDAGRALEALDAAGFETERPPEEWLVKAWSEGVLVDLIYDPAGLDVREAMKRYDSLNVLAIGMKVMKLEDILVAKLLTLREHWLDYESILEHSRTLREQIDWDEIRSRTTSSPYAKAFFTLVEELGVVERAGPSPNGSH